MEGWPVYRPHFLSITISLALISPDRRSFALRLHREFYSIMFVSKSLDASIKANLARCVTLKWFIRKGTCYKNLLLIHARCEIHLLTRRGVATCYSQLPWISTQECELPGIMQPAEMMMACDSGRPSLTNADCSLIRNSKFYDPSLVISI